MERQIAVHCPHDLAKAGVMVVALKGHEAQATGKHLAQCGQLLGNQLICERIGFCGNAAGHMVILGKARQRIKVGHGLAHPRACLHCQVRRAVKRIPYRLSKLHLLSALLKGFEDLT